MSGSTTEIEQSFVPTSAMRTQIMEKHDKKLEIVQGYAPADTPEYGIRRSIHFSTDPISKAESALIHLTTSEDDRSAVIKVDDANVIATLKDAYVKSEGKFLDNLRIRTQVERLPAARYKQESFATFKGPKTAGEGEEFEFPIPNQAAMQMLINHCHEKLVHKYRYVVNNHELAGKPRILELDVFQGSNNGIVKLEIEHKNREDWITDHSSFADREITEDKKFSNYNMAQADTGALIRLRGFQTAISQPVRVV